MFFWLLVAGLGALWYFFFPRIHRPQGKVSVTRRFSEKNVSNKFFDYIVVGTGPAGCALANKLSEKKNVKGEPVSILMVEAGADHRTDDQARVPSLWALITQGFGKYMYNALDWGYEVHLKNHKKWDSYARGKTLGGSGTVNAQMWVLGDPKDWDNWGLEDWSWAKVKPCFDWLNDKVKTRLTSTNNGTLKMLMESQKKAFGMEIVKDHQEATLANKQESFISYNRQNNSETARVDPFSALIEPLLSDKDKNIVVVDNAQVHRVAFNDDKEAMGVIFKVQGTGTHFAGARKEVILSAGSIGSAQILMLSGIGPKEQLTNFGIEVVQDLPVGQGLIEHGYAATSAFLKEPAEPCNGSFLDCTGFYKSAWSKKNEPERGRDIQCIFYSNPPLYFPYILGGVEIASALIPSSSRATLKGKMHYMLQRIIIGILSKTHVLDKKLHKLIAVACVVNHTRSRGSVMLRSNNPEDSPEIDLGLLNAPEDVERLVDCLKKQLKMYESEPLKSKLQELHPKTKRLVGASDDVLKQHIRETGSHAWHPTSTAAIGRVVEPNLKVKGVNRLRVADCSIMPQISSGNTMIPAYLCGARAGDILLAEN